MAKMAEYERDRFSGAAASQPANARVRGYAVCGRTQCQNNSARSAVLGAGHAVWNDGGLFIANMPSTTRMEYLLVGTVGQAVVVTGTAACGRACTASPRAVAVAYTQPRGRTVTCKFM